MIGVKPEDTLRDSIMEKYIAHFRGELKNSLFLDSSNLKENKLIYPAANTIAFSTLNASFENEKTQSFLTALPNSKGIVCVTQSQNKRYLAWCEQTDTVPVIFIVDLFNNLKRKAHANTDIKGTKYLSLAFNGNEVSDPKYLAALTSGADQQVLLLHIDKLKSSLHSLDKSERQAGGVDRFTQLFYYREEDTLVAMGRGTIKFYKISPEKLQPKDSPFARREVNEKDFNFTSQCILKDGLIIGTETGDLLYFAANGEFKAILSCSPGQHYSIETLAVLPMSGRAFIAGGSDGLLCLFEKTESKESKSLYARSDRKLALGDHKGRVTNLLVTPKEDELFVGLNTGVLLRVSLDKNVGHGVEHALQWFHTETICGMDVCLRKPIVATCATDRSVRLWNYLQKNSLEVVKVFQQKPLSLSLHPSGLHLLVSFPDRVRIFNIINGELAVCKDISIKNCSQVRFSHGGHLFAAVNNVMVQLFAFYTLDQPAHYQFKAQAGKFTTIVWEEDDLALFLGTSDGFVFYYKLDDPSVRLQVLAAPGFCVRSLACLFTQKDEKLGVINQRTLYAGGSFGSAVSDENKWIYQVKITPRAPEKDRDVKDDRRYVPSAPNKIYTHCDVARVMFLHSRRVLLYVTEVGGRMGCLRYCRYPLKESREVYEMHSHFSRITQLAISLDDNYIFTAGGEGEFVVNELRDSNSKSKVEMPDLSEQFLFSSSELTTLQDNLNNLRLNNAAAKEEKQRENKEARDANDRLLNDLQLMMGDRERSERARYDKEVQEISRMEREQLKCLARLEAQHKDKRETVEKDYSEKIQLEQTRFAELGKTKEAENRKFKEIVETIKTAHSKRRQRREEQFESELAKEKTELREAQQIQKALRQQYEEEQEHYEVEAEREIKGRKEENESAVKNLQEQNNKAENEKLSKKKLFETQERELQEQKHRLKHTLEDIEKIKQKHEENVQKRQSQAKEIEEREKTIRDKVTRINELKKKTQELQKFKFVLDYKIKELKRDIGPREEEIAKMREQIANMNSEILHFKGTNDNMNLIVKDLVSKRSGMDKELAELTRVEHSNLAYIKSFEYDLNDLMNYLEQYKPLKVKLVDLYRKYVQEDSARQAEGIDQQKQFIKERAHLESTVKGLKQKFKKSIDLHEADNKRIMSQNEELISEINDLKREKKNLKDEALKKDLQKEHNARLLRQRDESLLTYEKLVKDYNHLLEQERKNRHRKD